MLAAKLALVAASVLLSSWVARRFGHAAGGLLAGMPMIAGPITGLLLIDLPSATVRAVCLATLACQPALMAYFVAFAHAARAGWRWWACLVCALVVFFVAGRALLALPLPEVARIALALVSPLAGAMALPREGERSARSAQWARESGAATGGGAPGGHGAGQSSAADQGDAAAQAEAAGAALAASAASLQRIELMCRVAVAVAVAAGVMWGATHLGAAWAGLLLAAPITGIVLPSFTLPRHGPSAVIALLAGFVRGQAGFVIFFVLMLMLLPAWPAGPGWLLAMAASGLLPWLWVLARRRASSRRREEERAKHPG